MSKKIIGVVFGLLLGVMVLPQSAAALPPLQQKLSQSQISAIIALLQSFGAEQSVINNVSVSLNGGTPSNTGSGISCIELSYNLFSGSADKTSNGQVTKLQRFLGVSQTGYFGPETEAAVQRWQAQNGVVSSGSPDSTGYGYVGAKTRAAMRCGVGNELYGATPTIKILTPNGGESYNLARDPSMTLKWDATNVPYGATFVVEFQRQDGDRRQVSKMIADGMQRSYIIPSVGEFGDSSLHLVPGTYRVVMWIGNVGENQSARDFSDGTITITSPTYNTSSATIDRDSLTQEKGNFAITGTASNVEDVTVIISTYDYHSTDFNLLSGQVGKDGIYSFSSLVRKERWSIPFYWNNVTTVFDVFVFDTKTKQLLAKDKLTVTSQTNSRESTADMILKMATGRMAKDYVYDFNHDFKITSADSLLYLQGHNPTSETPIPECTTAESKRGQNGETYTCACPNTFARGVVWGGDLAADGMYTDDSNICTAALQTDVAWKAQINGGFFVSYTIWPGRNSYTGTTVNGVTSKSYGSWPGSFKILIKG